MTKQNIILAYAHKNPIFVGFFTMLATIVFGMSVAIVAGFVTPAEVYAQVVGAPCCSVPAPVVPPVPIIPPVVIAPAPIPSCTLSADSTTLPAGGGSVTLTWTTVAGTSASIDNNVGDVAPVESGSKSVSVQTTTNFTMLVSGPGGQTSCSATITVTSPPPPPPPVYGCMDPVATNYDPKATSQAGVTCIYPPIVGCMDTTATNYDPKATSQAGVTCTYPKSEPASCSLAASPMTIVAGQHATLSWQTTNFQPYHNFSIDHGIGQAALPNGSVVVSPNVTTTYSGVWVDVSPSSIKPCSVTITVTNPPVVIRGCTDPAATNYNKNATIDDGSCTYPVIPSAPTCTLSASPSSVVSGNSSTLTWVTTNASSFSIDTGIGSLTPVVSGSKSVSPSVTTTYTGTAVGANGTATCSATVTVTTTQPPSDAPTCTLSVSPTQVSQGDHATLTWVTTNANTFSIDHGLGAVTPALGGSVRSLAINANTTFTGTVVGPTGKTVECAANVSIATGGGSGGGGGGGGSGGGSGGGGSPSPVITLSTLPHIAVQPLAYLYLSQIPYTGLDLGPVGTALYWIALVVGSLILAYLILFGAVPFVNRSARDFGARVSAIVNTSQPAAATAAPSAPAPIIMDEIEQESPRGYSSYDGFKSFARNGALSIEDIVKGLSREHAVHSVEETSEPAVSTESDEPVVQEAVVSDAVTVRVDNNDFVASLVSGDREAVFAYLRQHVRGGGAPEQIVSSAACLLDETYRSRIDGVSCDETLARLTARLDTPLLEKLIAALTTAIDSSYADPMTGAKIALTRALAVLGA